MKELSPGTIFEYEGEELLVVERKGCGDCVFANDPCGEFRAYVQECAGDFREDKIPVAFPVYKDYILKRLGAKP